MILFLTLCYCVLLAAMVKLGVVKLTLWWRLSPLAWMGLLLCVLFLPMQWGAPTGEVQVYNYVIEIIPNVSGEAIETPVESLTPVAEGDVLFRIDPRPYQAEVDRLEAGLAAAEQDVPQLEAAYEASVGAVEQAIAQRDLAELNYDRAASLQETNAGAVSQLQVDQTRQTLLAAEAAVRAAEALREQAQLAWKSEINGENTRVAELKAQLETARLNLDWTTVRAPADGMLVNNFLRTGQRVANFPVRSWTAFLDRDGTRIGVGLPQYVLRHVEPGQRAEVVLKLHPGATFDATVESIAPINAEGQIQASGAVPELSSSSSADRRFIVILRMDDDQVDPSAMPGGAVGTAAIYTQRAQATHLIRRVMMRMQTWMNFIVP